ncbi:RusA family crossover junction endodeoxyribonuclease [Verrucomicrobium sp. BvORR106]|uniref:RusA family crossover junction endodeoxyribonuclease n=1 Tax=Verrucomicrobium sp. BvORR106 TaxID=1403819 RepID=UPI00068A4E17|nr:RusA family crossover junction endodeoxyribonuclease [Verrucomicrobium sp. BvORR106]
MNQQLSFFIPGVPAPGGSKRFVGFGKKTKRAILIDDAGQRNKDWRTAVGWAAHEHFKGEVLTGALKVTFTFFMPRPKGHHGKRGLRPSAPTFPITKPDALKLARSTEDALTGIVWRDDAQVVDGGQKKRYADTCSAGCLVEIEELSNNGGLEL